MRKKVVSAILCASMVAGMVVIPGVAVKADDKKLIGVTMPTKDLQRWNQDGENMKKELEAAGYEVDLQYASNYVSTQVSQLENQVANGCDLLVVASIDGSSLGEPLKQAKEAGIPVISYDRLLMNSDAVTYYATFDNYKVGQKQGEYLVDALDLDNQDGPFNIELFTGDPGDNNCNFFFGGAMDVLQKYIDEGKLVVKSGQTEFEQVATANWDSAKAQDRMDTIIAGNYSDGSNLDAVLCSNDSTALGVENALAAESAGVSALAMHGRTREQMYTGHCDHETLARVAKAITKIPFIGNGDVRSVQDAKLMIEELGVDAVMVGRAAMNNPYIFTQINHFFETGEELPELPFDKKLDIAEDHLKRLVDLKGEKIAVREFRGLAPHYLRGTAGAAKVRGEVSRAESVAQVEEIFATLR